MANAPLITLPATGNETFDLAAQRGKKVVIYFYPKDSTPGCTTESGDFRDRHAEFLAANAIVVGISRDSLKSHENFKTKQELPFPLLSDAEEIACQAYGVIKMKKLYGKEVRGIERSTFVVAADGSLAREWRGVKVPGHAQEVLDFVKSL
jgi:peroxiredoxin Q/BCP